jgi:hypothetical protein
MPGRKRGGSAAGAYGKAGRKKATRRSSTRYKMCPETDEGVVGIVDEHVAARAAATKKDLMGGEDTDDYLSDESEDVMLTSLKLKARSRGGTVEEREMASLATGSAVKGGGRQESSDEDSDSGEEEKEAGHVSKEGDGMPDPAKKRLSTIMHHLDALKEVGGPELTRCLVSGGAMEDYNKVMKKEGLVEIEESVRYRVEKIGRDVVFDHLKFSSALNAGLFVHKGLVMNMVASELRMEPERVTELRWAEWCAAVKKGLADRRNGCRNNLREEVKGKGRDSVRGFGFGVHG